jgi:hypothetical protein
MARFSPNQGTIKVGPQDDPSLNNEHEVNVCAEVVGKIYAKGQN